jgi:hypothetical protein
LQLQTSERKRSCKSLPRQLPHGFRAKSCEDANYNAEAFARTGGPGSRESIIKLHTTSHIVRVGDFQWTKNHAGNWHTVGEPSPHGTRYVPKTAKDAQVIAEYME